MKFKSDGGGGVGEDPPMAVQVEGKEMNRDLEEVLTWKDLQR